MSPRRTTKSKSPVRKTKKKLNAENPISVFDRPTSYKDFKKSKKYLLEEEIKRKETEKKNFYSQLS